MQIGVLHVVYEARKVRIRRGEYGSWIAKRDFQERMKERPKNTLGIFKTEKEARWNGTVENELLTITYGVLHGWIKRTAEGREKNKVLEGYVIIEHHAMLLSNRERTGYFVHVPKPMILIKFERKKRRRRINAKERRRQTEVAVFGAPMISHNE
jgi:hypothetical protein